MILYTRFVNYKISLHGVSLIQGISIMRRVLFVAGAGYDRGSRREGAGDVIREGARDARDAPTEFAASRRCHPPSASRKSPSPFRSSPTPSPPSQPRHCRHR